MHTRTLIVAELASGHGGDWSLAARMIRAAADAGADIVKVQLYDAADLKDSDPQKPWLAQAQISSVGVLHELMRTADGAGVKFTASVFSESAARLAKAAGLAVIKLGSGEVGRDRLRALCHSIFAEVWESRGMQGGTPDHLLRNALVVPFGCVSQYPTPYLRGYSALRQLDKRGRWGWSDHGDDLEVAKEAICEGAAFVERHFNADAFGARRVEAWDSGPSGIRELRRHAEACQWTGAPEWQQARDKYIGRWGA
jgi:N,N'-diacetyllegionaminate synthase